MGVRAVGREIFVSRGCTLARGVVLYSPCHIFGAASLGEGCVLLPGCVVNGAKIGKNCTLGPYCNVREGCAAGEGCRIGDFVELKRAVLGEGCKRRRTGRARKRGVRRGVRQLQRQNKGAHICGRQRVHRQQQRRSRARAYRRGRICGGWHGVIGRRAAKKSRALPSAFKNQARRCLRKVSQRPMMAFIKAMICLSRINLYPSNGRRFCE